MSQEPTTPTRPDAGQFVDPLAEAAHHLPLPSIYPVTLAAGITLLLTGFLYGIVFVLAGLALLALALWGWIGEVNRDRQPE